MSALLEVSHLRKEFDDQVILKDVNLSQKDILAINNITEDKTSNSKTNANNVMAFTSDNARFDALNY